jgi:hypothetical protein
MCPSSGEATVSMRHLLFVTLKHVDSLIVHQVGFIYKIIQGSRSTKLKIPLKFSWYNL